MVLFFYQYFAPNGALVGAKNGFWIPNKKH